MKKKNPFSEASKLRRKLINERNASPSSGKAPNSNDKSISGKENLIDLSRKDNKSPKGLYV